MKWFKKSEPEPEKSTPAVEAKPVRGRGPKGHPTPKRSQSEARNLKPLVPADRKAADKASREQKRAEQQHAYERMMAGDERYFRTRDRGPLAAYIRDYIDARYSIGEIFVPLSFAILIALLVIGQGGTRATMTSFVALMSIYIMFVLAIIDALVVWFIVRHKLAKKYPDKHLPWSYVFYVFGRCFQFRSWRQPKPRVKRRQFPK